MDIKILFLIVMSSFIFPVAQSQVQHLNLEIEEISIPNTPAIQSYVHAYYNNKILLMGGRTDGLHDHRPPFSFLPSNANDQIYVIDPMSNMVWSKSVNTLPVSISEQLLATNIEFTDDSSYIYLVGGYGYSNQLADHTTHPVLTIIDKPGLINAIINNQSIQSYFRQITDNRMAVTGGFLGKIDSTFYLLGGQRFEGRYNPHGPNHGPGFVQEYTNAIRTFQIADDGVNFMIQNYAEQVDSSYLHRRDFNALPQIFPNGKQGFTLFTGVFQYGRDIPWLTNVDITPDGYNVDTGFNQLLNQYHSASFSAYDKENNRMHNIFFGGIAMYYFDENEILWEDSTIPFVKTVSSITRDLNGVMNEVAYDFEMPGFLGASASYIFRDDVPLLTNRILDLNAIDQPSTHIGYIYGGIESNSPNVFMMNTGSTNATNRVFKVLLNSTETGITPDKNLVEYFNCYPNPASGLLNIDVGLRYDSQILLRIMDSSGRELAIIEKGKLNAGMYSLKWITTGQPAGIYFCELTANNQSITRKFTVQ